MNKKEFLIDIYSKFKNTQLDPFLYNEITKELDVFSIHFGISYLEVSILAYVFNQTIEGNKINAKSVLEYFNCDTKVITLIQKKIDRLLEKKIIVPDLNPSFSEQVYVMNPKLTEAIVSNINLPNL